MRQKHIRVSLVIPAYNEENHLKACLDAVADLNVLPYEVIVVDNMSTDQTAAIARSYSFVRLIQERRRGVVFARDSGFNAARGEVIGRIDADTILSPEWTETVQNIFANNGVDAVSGRVHYYDITWEPLVDAVDYFFRKRLARILEQTDSVFLQGANMAIRRDAWQHVRQILCHRGQIHEDFDLAIHLQEYGHRVIFDEQLKAGLSSRRADVSFIKLMHYISMSPRTYAVHNISSRRHMYPVVAVSVLLCVPARILCRGYNPRTGAFSLGQVLTLHHQIEGRIDPTSVMIGDS